jgi:hypothetical protein
MAQHLLSGGSLSSIAGDLNRRGLGTAYSTTWSTRKVKDVLDNPRLCGRVVHRGEVRPNIRGQWGTILDEDTFDAVQLAMAARRRVEDSWTNRRQHLERIRPSASERTRNAISAAEVLEAASKDVSLLAPEPLPGRQGAADGRVVVDHSPSEPPRRLGLHPRQPFGQPPEDPPRRSRTGGAAYI